LIPAEPNSPLRIDLGCGNAKREGFVGLDFVEGPQVDYILDLTRDPFPFDDDSVDEVFSAHFLEHIDEPNHVFSEIGRVCRDGATIVFYTPYAFTNEAFLYGHEHGVTEELWSQFCVHHRDVFAEMLGGRWQLNNVNFVLTPEAKRDMDAASIPLGFALKYFKGLVREFGVEIEYQSDLATPMVLPRRTWSMERFGPKYELDDLAVPVPASGSQARPSSLASRVPLSIRRLIPARVRTALRPHLERM